jgi:hypothetical protein
VPVILADCGFGSPAFLRQLLKHRFHFVVRLTKSFCYLPQGKEDWLSFTDFRVRRSRVHDFGLVLFTKTAPTPIHLVVTHDRMQLEPWILASDIVEPSLVIQLYGLRFRIEEAFKDLKDIRRGFQLKDAPVKVAERLNRLLAATAIAYLLIVLAGHHAETEGMHKDLQVNTSDERCLATWRVGRAVLLGGKVGVSTAIGCAASTVIRFTHSVEHFQMELNILKHAPRKAPAVAKPRRSSVLAPQAGLKRTETPDGLALRLRLRELIRQAGLTYRTVAHAIGVGIDTVKQVLSGKMGLPPAWIRPLLTLLNLSRTQFLGGIHWTPRPAGGLRKEQTRTMPRRQEPVPKAPAT